MYIIWYFLARKHDGGVSQFFSFYVLLCEIDRVQSILFYA